MKLPIELAEIFLEHIDLTYLSKYPHSSDPQSYLDEVEYHMGSFFKVSWSEGGTSGSCWSDELQDVGREDEPEMSALIEFLDQYFPELDSDHKYEVIRSADSKTYYENDYYGGSVGNSTKNINYHSIAEKLIPILYKDSTQFVDLEDLLKVQSQIIVNMSLEDYPKLKFHQELQDKIQLENTTKKSLKI